MKSPIKIFILAFFIVFYSACKKKENVASYIKPSTIDSTKTTDSVVVSINLYPIDTYRGRMVIHFYGQVGFITGYDSSLTDYEFNVKHIGADLLAIKASKCTGIGDTRFSVMNEWDTGVLNSQKIFYGKYYKSNGFPVKNELPLEICPDLYVFKLKDDSLSASWDDQYVYLGGCAVYGEFKGEYSGVKNN